MPKLSLQRFVLAFVLMLATLAVVSSTNSCRRIDILNPKDSTDKDTNNHRDTTIIRDTNTTDTGMVVNGRFDQVPGTFLNIPAPWTTWPASMPSRIAPQWSQANGCGSGYGSMMFYTGDETAVGEEMNIPFLHNHVYKVSFCANVTAADSMRSPTAQIEIRTSQDNGVSFTTLAVFQNNAMGWNSYSKAFTCPIDSKTIYVFVSGTNSGDAWVSIDNVQVIPQ